MNKKQKNKVRAVIACFFVLLFVGATVALYLPLRPTYSEAEKRELTKFPEFSVQTLLDGSYFNGISTWYSDTFPFREMFINANSKIKSFYGIGDSISGFADEIGDDIPVIPEEPTGGEAVTDPPTTEAPDKADDPLIQKLSSVIIVDNAAYEYYSFIRSTADGYAATVSRAANTLKDKSRVFCMVIPTSIDIMLDDDIRKNVSTTSQDDAINYIYSVMSPNVAKIKLYEPLRARRNEYIYFRTDHHWTALGAYYAYCEYAAAAGLEPAPLTAFEEKQFDNFVGAFYNDSGKDPALEKDPDTVYAYKPIGNIKLEYTDPKGNKTKWPVIADVTDWSRGSKYNTFIGGDQPYVRIVNADITDGSSCLVIKESFGNAMVPFLTLNYSEVHVIDYRYWKGDINEFAKENGIDDVIFLNNISATRNKSLMNTLSVTVK
ncbi:MAG: hypothetical protein IKK09_06360 [Clostridia bacterium]|nr:hypothetical protein [Clostridia bacterium]